MSCFTVYFWKNEYYNIKFLADFIKIYELLNDILKFMKMFHVTRMSNPLVLSISRKY